MMKKKMFTIALCAILTASMAACNSAGSQSSSAGSSAASSNTSSEQTSSGVQVPNPIVTCENIEEAEDVAGFAMTLPESIDGYTLKDITAIKDQMIQVVYEGDDGQISLRKGAGTDDISGDYTAYTEEETVTVGDASVIMKGEAGMVKLATWTKDGHAFAVSADAVDTISMMDLVGAIG